MNLKTAFAVLAAAFAAAALEAKDQYDIRPGESSSAALTAVEWQATNATRLAAATTPEALAAHVATAEAAATLLEKVKGAYHTDPLDAHVIGAVSQYVMTLKGGFSLAFWKSSVAPERRLWAAALLKRAEDASDAYVKQFCIDQLRWCGLKCQAAAIAAIGEKSSDKGVKDLAYIASKELSR